MHITFEVSGLPITLEAEPKEIIEVLKAMGCGMPKAPAVKVSAHRVPAGAREEKIKGVWHLFYVDADGEPSVAGASNGKYNCWFESDFNKENVLLRANIDSLSACNDYAIIGDWVRSVWESEK